MDTQIIDRMQETFDRGVEEVQRYLQSDEGRELRHKASMLMIAAAPMVGHLARKRLPMLGRLIETAGVATLVVKAAEKIRDWEPPAPSPAPSPAP